MPWKWYEKELVRVEDYNSVVKRFWIDMGEEELDFVPGQFITMDLPISEKRLKRWRSYSIASRSVHDKLMEFIIVRVEEGLGSGYLFHDVKVGDSIKFKGPSGGFVVPKEPHYDMVMICTGTGVAPFRPMIYDLLENQKTNRNIELIFGTREESGLLYREEFEDLEKQYPNFKYSPCLSRQEGIGHYGYVHDVYIERYGESRNDVKFLLCGWTQMIDEAVANLVEKLGYDKSQVVYELYG